MSTFYFIYINRKIIIYFRGLLLILLSDIICLLYLFVEDKIVHVLNNTIFMFYLFIILYLSYLFNN